MSEICICAAVRLHDGYIVRGHRHHDCLRTIAELQRCGWVIERVGQDAQGFLTTNNRFVDRVEGARLMREAGKLPDNREQLFSEDLY